MKRPSLPALRRADLALKQNAQKLYLEVLLELCHQNGSLSFVPEIIKLLRSKRYPELLKLADSLSSQCHDDATQHFVANQFAMLIRKYPWNPSLVGTDPEGTAKRTWLRAEHLCKRHNARFNIMQNRRSPNESLISRVRGFIEYTIGLAPNLDTIYNLCEFSGGASLGIHGNATNLGRKLSSQEWSVTPGAHTHFFNALSRNMSYFRLLLEERTVSGAQVACWDPDVAWENFNKRVKLVRHNKIGFVPKTAKTLRPIAVEPVGNGYLQKGTDLYLRHRLKRVGLDLSDQSRNQAFARFGSEDWDKTNPFCTIDLSSASDSISDQLCKMVLPEAWYRFLNDIRSQWYELDGSIRKYEKFCSMGNGFCFPLETLIFAAVCSAVSCGIPKRDFVVYGDDIIVRKDKFQATITGLRYLGFTPNLAKTFSEGPFRESCGADWYKGEDVRPYTLDHELDSVQNLFKFINLTRRNVRSASFFAGIYLMILDRIPKSFHFFRPYGPPDSGIDLSGLEHLVSPFVHLSRLDSCYRWYEISTYPVKDTLMIRESVRIACALRGDATLVLRRRNTCRITRKRGG